MTSSTLQTDHLTHVHHLEVDPSGSLLATCSSDRTVQLFYRKHQVGTPDSWEEGCTIADHTGPVMRLAWCQHREHGPLLATAGADRWIYIYRITLTSHKGRTVVQASRWSPLRGFEKDAITDVAFIPPQQYHVLLLSTASLDGCVRLYEVNQPLQFPCICRMIPEVEPSKDGVSSSNAIIPNTKSVDERLAAGATDGGSRNVSKHVPPISNLTALPGMTHSATARNLGITSISWFPGAAESTMTLAVGAVSGRVRLYRYLKEANAFSPIPILPASLSSVCCTSPVLQITWAPSVGRLFQLLAICSRTEVLILRMNCISPSNEEGDIFFELFRSNEGAASVSWSRSASHLYVVTDDERATVKVLQMRDPMDHQSWEIVSQNTCPP